MRNETGRSWLEFIPDCANLCFEEDGIIFGSKKRKMDWKVLCVSQRENRGNKQENQVKRGTGSQTYSRVRKGTRHRSRQMCPTHGFQSLAFAHLELSSGVEFFQTLYSFLSVHHGGHCGPLL